MAGSRGEVKWERMTKIIMKCIGKFNDWVSYVRRYWSVCDLQRENEPEYVDIPVTVSRMIYPPAPCNLNTAVVAQPEIFMTKCFHSFYLLGIFLVRNRNSDYLMYISSCLCVQEVQELNDIPAPGKDSI